MRTSILGLAAVSLASFAVPALAQDAAPAPASPFTITGGATITSDYRFRGISQTNKRFAVQGTLGVAHESGFYVGAWGSSIDDYVAAGSDQEIDLYGGWKHTFNGTTLDAGLLYYYYPGGGRATNTDFFEPYANLSHSFGPVGVKVGANYAWKQHAIAFNNSRDDNLYTYGELSAGIPNTGVTVTGHLGHSFGRSFLTGGYKGYTDWSVTAAYTWKALTFSAAYVDTNKRFRSGGPTLGIPSPSAKDRDIGKAGVVGAVAVAF